MASNLLVEGLWSQNLLIYMPLLLLVGHGVLFLFATLRPKGFPPGPRGVPGLGNLLQIDRKFPFRTFSAWARASDENVPLGLKKAAGNLVVLSSPRLVRELFEKRGAVYSNRPWQYINRVWVMKDDLRAALIEDSSPWLARWRKEFAHYFDQAAVARFRPLYEAETARLLVKLVETPMARKADLEDLLVCWILSVPCLSLCGRRPDEMAHYDFHVKKFRQDQEEYMTLLTPGAGDVFPLLRCLPEIWGLAPWKTKARYVREELLKESASFLAAAKEQRLTLDEGRSFAMESILAKMLREQREQEDYMFTTKDLGMTGVQILSAAMNTSLATFSIGLMLFAKYPEIQQRTREEVLGVLGGAAPRAVDISNLKYLEAFFNEILRWRPVGPQAAAHSPSRDDVVSGYRIPKGATVIANVWHMYHSEANYEKPEEFDPERFLRHPLGLRLEAQEAQKPADGFEVSVPPRLSYIFGFGRRICPGMDSARQSLMLGLAKVIWAFDILPPEDKDIDMDLDTGFISDLALRPKDFDVVLKLRDGRSKSDIMDHYDQAYKGQAEIMDWKT